jgi:hypothetical protein
MKKLNHFNALLAAVFFCTALYGTILLAEAESFAQIDMSGTHKDDKIKTIALVPFTSKSALSEELSDDQLATNERFLTISLYDALTANVVGVKIKPLQESEAVYNKISSEKPGSYYRDLAVSAGKNLGVDAVMTGVISRYTQRKGSQIGVEAPASVAFSVILLDTESGEIMWETYFSETQKALLDNVYDVKKFFKRGAKWITADELAKEGARKTALEFNEYLLEN